MAFLASCRSSLWFVFSCCLVVCFTGQQVSAQVETEKRSFDVSEGYAINTLKEAAQQAEVEFIFSADLVKSVRTPSIQGEFTPLEAFSLMLAETSLDVFQHEQSGVYAITKVSDIQIPELELKPIEETEMNTKKNNWLKTLAAVLTLGIAGDLPPVQAQENDDEVYELSPFTVDESESTIGYQATSTLAGSRLNTPLRDIGSAIQVITQELFEDTGSTNMEEILPYALSTEVHGPLGNFSGGPGSGHRGRFEQDLQRASPQTAQRVRGLASASLTRNFFLTDIPFEGYNTSRIAINRGANSLLFGVGAAGGIINNTIKQARADGEDFGEISLRFGERDSYRATLDYHKVLIEDRLAVRLMTLSKDTQYKQRPSFERDKRITVNIDAVLFENNESDFLGKTRLRLDAEWGDIDGSPPILVPPNDGFTDFFQKPDIAALEAVPGTVIPGYYKSEAETPVGRSWPQFGYGAWAPKQTYDTRLGFTRGNVPSVVERSFHRLQAVYDTNGKLMTLGNHEGQSFIGSHGGSPTGYIDADGNPAPIGQAGYGFGVDGNVYPVAST